MEWKKKQRKKTWVKLFKEFQKKITTVSGAKSWLEKEALLLRKRDDYRGISVFGAKWLIRSNLTYLVDHYFSEKEKEKLSRLLGLTYESRKAE